MRIEYLDEDIEYIYLRFAGTGHAFRNTLTRFKAGIRPHSRTWDEDTFTWRVLKTEATLALLADILPTFTHELTMVRSQLSFL